MTGSAVFCVAVAFPVIEASSGTSVPILTSKLKACVYLAVPGIPRGSPRRPVCSVLLNGVSSRLKSVALSTRGGVWGGGRGRSGGGHHELPRRDRDRRRRGRCRRLAEACVDRPHLVEH